MSRRARGPERGWPLAAAVAGVAVAAAAGMVLGSAASARAAEPAIPLVEGSTTTARLAVPYPGHTTAFDLTARPTTDGPSDLALVVTGGTGPLADGPDALVLTIEDPAGTVLAQGTAAELDGRPVDLGTLDDEPLTLHGAAALADTAGDDLQGVGLSLTFQLVASQLVASQGAGSVDAGSVDATPGADAVSDVLAVTGASVGALLAAVGVLLVLGVLLLALRRRRSADDHEPAGTPG